MARLAATVAKTILSCSVCLTGVTLLAQCPSQSVGPVADLQTRLDATVRELKKTSEESSRKTLQEKALEQLEDLQCAEEQLAPAEQVTRGPTGETLFASVPILFITDRASIAGQNGRHQYYGWDRRKAGVSFGELTVRLPAESYKAGDPVPRGITISSEKDAHAGVAVSMTRDEPMGQFVEAIHAYAKKKPTGERVRIMIFVHGFNVSFPEAAAAAARLAFGMRINILPVIVSWPSQAAMLKYWNDEENIEPSVERLRPIFQALLSNSDVDEVEIVSHSMGTRLVARVLSELQLQSTALRKLTRVSLAAADLNESEVQELWPRIQALPAKGWLFYTSKNDVALLASAIMHATPPIGDSRTRVFTLAPADTVDASAVAPMLKGYGHSYVIDNPLVRIDLRRWIAQDLGPAQRGLARGNRPSSVFWEIRN